MEVWYAWRLHHRRVFLLALKHHYFLYYNFSTSNNQCVCRFAISHCFVPKFFTCLWRLLAVYAWYASCSTDSFDYIVIPTTSKQLLLFVQSINLNQCKWESCDALCWLKLSIKLAITPTTFCIKTSATLTQVADTEYLPTPGCLSSPDVAARLLNTFWFSLNALLFTAHV